jgi:hypothetical protein
LPDELKLPRSNADGQIEWKKTGKEFNPGQHSSYLSVYKAGIDLPKNNDTGKFTLNQISLF